MTALQQISKKNLSIVIKGQQTPLPAYVELAASTYFFDSTSQILKKRCYICKQLFDIEQFTDETWIDIHNEAQYRKMKTGFSSYCVECLGKKKSKQMQKSEITKATFYLEKEIIRIIKIMATLEGISNSEYINKLVKADRKAANLSKLIDFT